MNQRKMYSGGLFYILLIPIGLIAVIYIYDFFACKYAQYQLDNATKEVLTFALDRKDFDDYEMMKDYCYKLYQKKEYDTVRMSLIRKDDYYILVNYSNYTSVVGSISLGYLRNKTPMIHSSYKGYYNEYKESVVEKYVEEDDEDDFDIDKLITE